MSLTIKDASGTSQILFTGEGDGSGTPFKFAAGAATVADDAAFTPATSRVMMIGCTFDDVVPDSVNEGDGGAVRMSANRCVYVNLRDNAGNERGLNIDSNGNLTANVISGQNGVAGGSGAAGATVQRVVLATDDPAVTSLGVMDDWDESDRAKANIIVGQAGVAAGAGAVGATVQRMTHASDDPVTVSVQLIDDTVFADDAAFTPATSKVLAIGFQADETATDSVDEGDIGCPRMTLDRRVRVASKATDGPGEPVIDSYVSASFNLAAGADQSLVSAPGANKQIWVYGVGFAVNIAGTVSFQDQDDTAITGIMPFGITGNYCVSPSGNFAMPAWKLPTNKALEVDVVTSELDGWIAYAIVSV